MTGKKAVFTLALTAMVLTSCDDFTQENLKFNTPPAAAEVNNVDLLLSESNQINTGEFTLEKLIANIGSFVMAPAVSQLDEDVKELNTVLSSHCRALNVLPELTNQQLDELRKPLQESWKKATLSYHRVATMSFGPSSDDTNTFNDSVYSFLKNIDQDSKFKCQIDSTLFKYSTFSNAGRNPQGSLPQFGDITNYHLRGLDALEPLFFADPNISRCRSVHPRVKQWFEKHLLEREKVVCAYTQHLMTDITKKNNRARESLVSPSWALYLSNVEGNERFSS